MTVCVDVCNVATGVVVVVSQEGGQYISDLLLAGVGRNGTRGDLVRGEVAHKHLQLGQTGVVGVADPVVAASLHKVG